MHQSRTVAPSRCDASPEHCAACCALCRTHAPVCCLTRALGCAHCVGLLCPRGLQICQGEKVWCGMHATQLEAIAAMEEEQAKGVGTQIDLTRGKCSVQSRHTAARAASTEAISVAENGDSSTGRIYTGTSKYRGVCAKSGSRQWRSQYQSNDVYQSLGMFDEEADAARAWDMEAVKHGRRDVNFPSSLRSGPGSEQNSGPRGDASSESELEFSDSDSDSSDSKAGKGDFDGDEDKDGGRERGGREAPTAHVGAAGAAGREGSTAHVGAAGAAGSYDRGYSAAEDELIVAHALAYLTGRRPTGAAETETATGMPHTAGASSGMNMHVPKAWWQTIDLTGPVWKQRTALSVLCRYAFLKAPLRRRLEQPGVDGSGAVDNEDEDEDEDEDGNGNDDDDDNDDEDSDSDEDEDGNDLSHDTDAGDDGSSVVERSPHGVGGCDGDEAAHSRRNPVPRSHVAEPIGLQRPRDSEFTSQEDDVVIEHVAAWFASDQGQEGSVAGDMRIPRDWWEQVDLSNPAFAVPRTPADLCLRFEQHLRQSLEMSHPTGETEVRDEHKPHLPYTEEEDARVMAHAQAWFDSSMNHGKTVPSSWWQTLDTAGSLWSKPRTVGSLRRRCDRLRASEQRSYKCEVRPQSQRSQGSLYTQEEDEALLAHAAEWHTRHPGVTSMPSDWWNKLLEESVVLQGSQRSVAGIKTRYNRMLKPRQEQHQEKQERFSGCRAEDTAVCAEGQLPGKERKAKLRMDYRSIHNGPRIQLNQHGSVEDARDRGRGRGRGRGCDGAGGATRRPCASTGAGAVAGAGDRTIPGITFNAANKKWRCYPTIRGRRVSVGTFSTLREATAAVEEARAEADAEAGVEVPALDSIVVEFDPDGSTAGRKQGRADRGSGGARAEPRLAAGTVSQRVPSPGQKMAAISALAAAMPSAQTNREREGRDTFRQAVRDLQRTLPSTLGAAGEHTTLSTTLGLATSTIRALAAEQLAVTQELAAARLRRAQLRALVWLACGKVGGSNAAAGTTPNPSVVVGAAAGAAQTRLLSSQPASKRAGAGPTPQPEVTASRRASPPSMRRHQPGPGHGDDHRSRQEEAGSGGQGNDAVQAAAEVLLPVPVYTPLAAAATVMAAKQDTQEQEQEEHGPAVHKKRKLCS